MEERNIAHVDYNQDDEYSCEQLNPFNIQFLY